MIPARLIRTVPAEPNETQQRLWSEACAMHPGWDHLDLRDPLDPLDFPATSPHWDACHNGAQRAGLIRLEALLRFGGIYLDSDVAVVRPLDELLTLPAFAAWEDRTIVPDAVLGAPAGHPAIVAALDLAVARLHGRGLTWRDDRGAWSTGPGVTTAILPTRHDVIVLPPDSFYPVHYAPRETLDARLEAFDPPPWCYGVHLWAWSWR
jgi:mannosyltransferase OCH1-like enzyme